MSLPDIGTPAPRDDLRPLREQVRDVLRARILDGTLLPGTRIYEREVAAEHGVSRVPVREAIRMLEAEGLVAVAPRRGVVVRELARKDVEDLFDLREALEVLESRLAARRASPAGVRRLRWLVDEARHSLAAGEVVEMNRANAAFHEEIARLADNPALSTVLEPVSTRLRWNYAQNAEPERVLAEHEALLDAIAAGDVDRAGEMSLHHVRAARRMVLGAVRS